MSRAIRTAVVLITILALAIPAAPLLAAPKPVKATVSGYVYGSDEIAIPGATVNVYLGNKNGVFNLVATLATDVNGWWSYAAKGGTYRFDFTAPSSDPQSQILTTIDGMTYQLNVTLNSYGSIGGTVTDASTGLPIPGAAVELYRRNPDTTWPTTPSATLTTAVDGTYASGQVLAGRYRIRASAVGSVSLYYGGSPTPGSATIVLLRRGSDVTGIDMALAPAAATGSIGGRVVTGATEVPCAGAYVWLYKQNADGSWPATSPGWGAPTYTINADSLGRYASGAIPLGNYRVRFFDWHDGSQWWQYVATFDLATTLSLTVGGEALTGIDGWYKKPL